MYAHKRCPECRVGQICNTKTGKCVAADGAAAKAYTKNFAAEIEDVIRKAFAENNADALTHGKNQTWQSPVHILRLNIKTFHEGVWSTRYSESHRINTVGDVYAIMEHLLHSLTGNERFEDVNFFYKPKYWTDPPKFVFGAKLHNERMKPPFNSGTGTVKYALGDDNAWSTAKKVLELAQRDPDMCHSDTYNLSLFRHKFLHPNTDELDAVFYALDPNNHVNAIVVGKHFLSRIKQPELHAVCSKKTGSAKPVVQKALEVARQLGKNHVIVKSVNHAIPYYERFGFKKVGDRTNNGTPMTKRLSNVQNWV